MARNRARSSLFGDSFARSAAVDGPVHDSDPARSGRGTRFRLFPQPPFLEHYRYPVTIRVSPRAGAVGPGPADDRMYAVAPIGKRRAYGVAPGPFGTPFHSLPPWDGPIEPPAMPDSWGHFDHIDVDAPEFEVAHAYAAVRWVLDTWERYLGGTVPWHFADAYDRLEISLFPEFDNAFCGYGYLEIGADFEHGPVQSFGLNFDVIAHETGHLIVNSVIGAADDEHQEPEFLGFHESAADVVAMLSAAQFEPVLDELFANTRGNLYALNELNRIGELSEQAQIRVASNTVRMSAFAAAWEEHRLSQPLTGAVFDILCDVYHRSLGERGLISRALEQLASDEEHVHQDAERIQAGFDGAYAADPAGFRAAFYDAREWLGLCIAQAWRRLSLDEFSYAAFGQAMVEVDRELSDGQFGEAIEGSFQWREIGAVAVGPIRLPPRYDSHLDSPRTLVPGRVPLPRMTYRERWELMRGG